MQPLFASGAPSPAAPENGLDLLVQQLFSLVEESPARENYELGDSDHSSLSRPEHKIYKVLVDETLKEVCADFMSLLALVRKHTLMAVGGNLRRGGRVTEVLADLQDSLHRQFNATAIDYIERLTFERSGENPHANMLGKRGTSDGHEGSQQYVIQRNPDFVQLKAPSTNDLAAGLTFRQPPKMKVENDYPKTVVNLESQQSTATAIAREVPKIPSQQLQRDLKKDIFLVKRPVGNSLIPKRPTGSKRGRPRHEKPDSSRRDSQPIAKSRIGSNSRAEVRITRSKSSKSGGYSAAQLAWWGRGKMPVKRGGSVDTAGRTRRSDPSRGRGSASRGRGASSRGSSRGRGGSSNNRGARGGTRVSSRSRGARGSRGGSTPRGSLRVRVRTRDRQRDRSRTGTLSKRGRPRIRPLSPKPIKKDSVSKLRTGRGGPRVKGVFSARGRGGAIASRGNIRGRGGLATRNPLPTRSKSPASEKPADEKPVKLNPKADEVTSKFKIQFKPVVQDIQKQPESESGPAKVLTEEKGELKAPRVGGHKKATNRNSYLDQDEDSLIEETKIMHKAMEMLEDEEFLNVPETEEEKSVFWVEKISNDLYVVCGEEASIFFPKRANSSPVIRPHAGEHWLNWKQYSQAVAVVAFKPLPSNAPIKLKLIDSVMLKPYSTPLEMVGPLLTPQLTLFGDFLIATKKLGVIACSMPDLLLMSTSQASITNYNPDFILQQKDVSDFYVENQTMYAVCQHSNYLHQVDLSQLSRQKKALPTRSTKLTWNKLVIESYITNPKVRSLEGDVLVCTPNELLLMSSTGEYRSQYSSKYLHDIALFKSGVGKFALLLHRRDEATLLRVHPLGLYPVMPCLKLETEKINFNGLFHLNDFHFVVYGDYGYCKRFELRFDRPAA